MRGGGWVCGRRWGGVVFDGCWGVGGGRVLGQYVCVCFLWWVLRVMQIIFCNGYGIHVNKTNLH